MRPLVLVLVTMLLSCGVATAAANGDDIRVKAGYEQLVAYNCDRAIAKLTAPYVEASAAGDNARAARYLQLIASAFWFDENIEAAVSCAQQAVILDPQSVSARTMLANQLTRLGRIAEAQAELAPLLPEAKTNWLVARALGSWYAVQGSVALSYDCLRTAERLQPSDARTHFLLARNDCTEDQQNELALAADCVESPYLHELYLWKLEEHKHPRNPDMQHVIAASKVLPDEPSWRVSMLWRKPDAERQAAMINAANCRRLYWRAFEQLALFAGFQNHPKLADEAISYYEKVNPNFADMYLVQSEVAFNRRDYAAARQAAEKALSLQPHQSLAYDVLKSIPGDGQIAQAREQVIERWLANCDPMPEPWLERGCTGLHHRQWQAAADDFRQAEKRLEYCRNHKERRQFLWCTLAAGLGTAQYKLGHKDVAAEYALVFNQLKSPDGNVVPVRIGKLELARLNSRQRASAQHAATADMLYENEQLDDAVAEYREALKLEDNPQWHRGLLKVLLDKGDISAAMKEDIIVANHAITQDLPSAFQRTIRQIRGNR